MFVMLYFYMRRYENEKPHLGIFYIEMMYKLGVCIGTDHIMSSSNAEHCSFLNEHKLNPAVIILEIHKNTNGSLLFSESSHQYVQH